MSAAERRCGRRKTKIEQGRYKTEYLGKKGGQREVRQKIYVTIVRNRENERDDQGSRERRQRDPN